MRSFCLIFSLVLCVSLVAGCQNSSSPIMSNGKKYYSLSELDGLDKFDGYDICVGPEIEGPYRIVPGVNYTVKREGRSPLKRELDFQDKRWKFEHEDSIGYSFRFLALGNPQGEACAIMLKSEEEVPHYLDTPLGKASVERFEKSKKKQQEGGAGKGGAGKGGDFNQKGRGKGGGKGDDKSGDKSGDKGDDKGGDKSGDKSDDPPSDEGN